MTARNLTSVVMVTYQTGPVLETAIRAVLAQTADIELILVNNGNAPEVEARLIERFKEDPSVRLMTGHGNIGLVRGNNLGARVAAGDHLLFLNPRCVLPKEAVATLRTEAAARKPPYLLGARLVDAAGKERCGSRLSLLSPETAMIEATRFFVHIPGRRLFLHDEPVPAKTEPVPAVGGAFMFMRKADYAQNHGFLELYTNAIADMDFCYRFAQMEGHIYFVPQIKVFMADRTRPCDRARAEEEKARALIRYFHENYSDNYFQPFLWALYGAIWLRGKVRALGLW